MEDGCALRKLLLWLCFLTFSSSLAIEHHYKKFPLLMPHVVPPHKDSYLCTSVRVDPTHEYYITAYEPNATKDVAHHMIVFGCEEPASSEDQVWSCGEMKDSHSKGECKGAQQIMYAWAKDAPELVLPDGVAFKVGGHTDVKFLVLQVHYASVEMFKGSVTDDSGVFIRYTETPQPKTAGIILLGTGGVIEPHSIEYMETACVVNERVVIHPFAFRTHTHSLGRVVSGYKVEMKGRDMEWTLIGKKDPQLPQMFYPVDNDMTLSKGDMIAARCTMESDRDSVTKIGPTNEDEMCNFYIMYWKEETGFGDKVPRFCVSEGPPHFYWSNSGLEHVPDDASFLHVEQNNMSTLDQ